MSFEFVLTSVQNDKKTKNGLIVYLFFLRMTPPTLLIKVCLQDS